MKKKLVLCTELPEKERKEIEQYCDITEAGALKYGKGHAEEEDITRADCMGYELVVLGDEVAHADTLNAWIDSGMKFCGVAKGTPVTVDNEVLKAAGIKLSYTPGRNRVAVAEYTMALMFAAARKMTLAITGLQKGEHLGAPVENIYDVPDIKDVTWGPLDEKHPYSDYGYGFELYGKKLGIAGYGAIGREVAVRAKAMGMEILAYDPYPNVARIEADGAKLCTLEEMLSQSDIVSLHLPVLPGTVGIVNRDWFSKMKKTAIVINTARAAIIDQKDFVEALQNGVIGGAAIDVYWQEPVPANHPLLAMRNVICSPHYAGLTTDVGGWSGKMMASEILHYLKGEPQEYVWTR